ncbi:MAG: aldehyde dehydrogenase family protein, partial [Vicinamibacteria bacterium]
MATAMRETSGGRRGRSKLECFNPATLEKIGEVDICTEEDTRAAVETARKAFETWSRLSLDERGRFMLAARDWLIDHLDEVIDTICLDTGKPRGEAILADVLGVADSLGFYAKKAKKYLSDEKVPLHLMKTKTLAVSYIPMGVVGIITPWNYPFSLAANPCIQAMMAGNTVILKPSEITSLVGLKVAEMFTGARVPDGVFQILTGDGSTGAALVNASCDKISFTGSVEVGRKIAEICGRRLVPVSLELGGKDPMIVCADADLARAARGAVYGAFANSGQVCTSTERVYVVEDVADEFTRRVLEETKALRQGSTGEFDVGAIACPQQLEIIEA